MVQINSSKNIKTTTERIKIGNRNAIVYQGKNGGKYVKIKGEYKNIKTLKIKGGDDSEIESKKQNLYNNITNAVFVKKFLNDYNQYLNIIPIPKLKLMAVINILLAYNYITLYTKKDLETNDIKKLEEYILMYAHEYMEKNIKEFQFSDNRKNVLSEIDEIIKSIKNIKKLQNEMIDTNNIEYIKKSILNIEIDMQNYIENESGINKEDLTNFYNNIKNSLRDENIYELYTNINKAFTEINDKLNEINSLLINNSVNNVKDDINKLFTVILNMLSYLRDIIYNDIPL